MSSNQTGGLPSNPYQVGPNTSHVSLTTNPNNRSSSPPQNKHPSIESTVSYEYNPALTTNPSGSKSALGLDRIFRKDLSIEPKIIADRDKSPKGLSRENTPTRSKLVTPDISKPGVKISPKPQQAINSDYQNFEKAKSPSQDAISDITSQLSENKARSTSWDPPRPALPKITNLSTIGNNNVNTNLSERFNSASDDPTPLLTGPGPALINSINRALEEGRNKGLLSDSEQKNSMSSRRQPNLRTEQPSGVILDPSSNPMSSPKDRLPSNPVSFPSQLMSSQENTFRNKSSAEERKREASLERETRGELRSSNEEYYETNNQDTVKKNANRGKKDLKSPEAGFATDSENLQPVPLNPVRQNKSPNAGAQVTSPLPQENFVQGRENYHKGMQNNIWAEPPNRNAIGKVQHSPPQKREQKSSPSTPNRSENGSAEKRNRGSSDKRKNLKDSPSKYITIESGPRITGESQRGSVRDSENRSHNASFYEQNQPKNQQKPKQTAPQTSEFGGLGNDQFAFFNTPTRPNIAMPSFGPDLNVMEVQNYLLFIMNFYEIHMNNLKSIIVQQNETITAQKARIRKSDEAIEEFREKIDALQNNIKIQKDQYDQSYEELEDKHRQALDELSQFKKNVDQISKQMDNSTFKDELDKSHLHNHAHDDSSTIGSKGASKLILTEIQEIRRELEHQRDLINEFKYTKNNLEHQMRDLERVYHEEMRVNSDFASRHNQVANTMQRYRESYNKLDRLNKIISEGYEKTRRELDTVRNSFTNEDDGYRRDRRYSPPPQNNSNIYLEQNQSPSSYGKLDRPRYRSMTPPHGNNGPEENAYEAIKKKMKERDDQAKELLYWQGSGKETRGRTDNSAYQGGYSGGQGNYDSQGYSGSQNYYNAKSPSSTLNDRDHQGMRQLELRVNRSPIQQDRRDSPGKQRNYGVMPSYQKYEDNREEIKGLEDLLTELNQDKKHLENELFRLPSSGGNIEQKKKKTALERDLEDVDSRIEECRNRLRSLDALTIR